MMKLLKSLNTDTKSKTMKTLLLILILFVSLTVIAPNNEIYKELTKIGVMLYLTFATLLVLRENK